MVDLVFPPFYFQIRVSAQASGLVEPPSASPRSTSLASAGVSLSVSSQFPKLSHLAPEAKAESMPDPDPEALDMESATSAWKCMSRIPPPLYSLLCAAIAVEEANEVQVEDVEKAALAR